MAQPVRYSPRRRRPIGTIVFLLLAAAGLAWIIVPLSRGEEVQDPLTAFDRWFGGDEVQAAEDSDDGPKEGYVRVPLSAVAIPAYEAVGRVHLFVPGRGELAYMDVEEELVEAAGILKSITEITGRVMAASKKPGYAFRESDFLPVGTRPGLSAGVPAGKRALRIEVDKVRGIVGLQQGDRFDMVAAMTLKDAPAPDFVGLYKNLAGGQAGPAAAKPRAEARVLVQNGVVVTALETRQIPTSTSSLTQGRTTKTLPVQEMVIALDPDEVAPLLEALSLSAEITCVARSGRPDDPEDSETPSSESAEDVWGNSLGGSAGLTGPMTVIESIDDEGRELVPVPTVREDEEGDEPR